MTDFRWEHTRSRAVLFGTAAYVHLPPVPAALNSLTRMESVLTGDLCGWPRERLSVFADQSRPGDLPDHLVQLFHDTEDVALFYYVGHGQVDPADTLCLGLVESRTESPFRKTTSLPFDAIRYALTQSRAKAKIVILDCCYAGLAAPGVLGAGDLIDQTLGTGAYTMAAAGEFARAWFETDDSISAPQTYFTKYIADVIEQGIPGEGPLLRLEPIFRAAAEALARDGKPVPTSRATGNALRLEFIRNAALIKDNMPSDMLSNGMNGRQLITAAAQSGQKPARISLNPRSSQKPWLYCLRAERATSPTVSGGRVYVGCAGHVEAIEPAPDAGIASLCWSYRTAGHVGWAPAVADGIVYAGSDAVYAIDSATGTLRWRSETSGSVNGPLAVKGRVVYAASAESNLYAFDAVNGVLRWCYQHKLLRRRRWVRSSEWSRVQRAQEYAFDSPAVVGETVYVGCRDGYLHAIEAFTGKLQWRYQSNGLPMVAGDTVYTGHNEYLEAIEGSTGIQRWRYETGGGYIALPAVADDTVYVSSQDGSLYAVDAVSGMLRWGHQMDRFALSAPVVSGDTAYLASTDGHAEDLHAIDTSNGTQRWRRQYVRHREEERSAYLASPTVADGNVYVTTQGQVLRGNAHVYAIDAATGMSPENDPTWRRRYESSFLRQDQPQTTDRPL